MRLGLWSLSCGWKERSGGGGRGRGKVKGWGRGWDKGKDKDRDQDKGWGKDKEGRGAGLDEGWGLCLVCGLEHDDGMNEHCYCRYRCC